MDALEAVTYCRESYDPGSEVFKEVLTENKDHGIHVGIVEKTDETILVFRGSITPLDWFRDFISYVPEKIDGEMYPEGFSLGCEDVLKTILGKIRLNVPVSLTGHSLGAAHAGIFYELFLEKEFSINNVFLFGCPNLVFDTKLKGQYPDFLSFQNENDFVCCVPPFPWTCLMPFIKLWGGHDPVPGPFMFHHIGYYEKGVKRWLSSQK